MTASWPSWLDLGARWRPAGMRDELSFEVYVWVMIGSALGGGARYWCSGFVANHFGETFPWGTLLINVLGSFVIGFFNRLTGPDGRLLVGTPARQFVMVGRCGGYTTFSSFSLQTLSLARDGEWLRAGANIGLSVMLCLIAVWLGHVVAVGLNQVKGMSHADPARGRAAAHLHR